MNLTIEVKVYGRMRQFLRKLGYKIPNVRNGSFYHDIGHFEDHDWELVPGHIVAHCYILAIQ